MKSVPKLFVTLSIYTVVKKDFFLVKFLYMKNLIYVLICMFTLHSVALAQDNSTTYAEKYSMYRDVTLQPKKTTQKTKEMPSEKSIVENEQAQQVYEYYGCINSPGYLNRENIGSCEDNNGGDD